MAYGEERRRPDKSERGERPPWRRRETEDGRVLLSNLRKKYYGEPRKKDQDMEDD